MPGQEARRSASVPIGQLWPLTRSTIPRHLLSRPSTTRNRKSNAENIGAVIPAGLNRRDVIVAGTRISGAAVLTALGANDNPSHAGWLLGTGALAGDAAGPTRAQPFAGLGLGVVAEFCYGLYLAMTGPAPPGTEPAAQVRDTVPAPSQTWAGRWWGLPRATGSVRRRAGATPLPVAAGRRRRGSSGRD